MNKPIRLLLGLSVCALCIVCGSPAAAQAQTIPAPIQSGIDAAAYTTPEPAPVIDIAPTIAQATPTLTWQQALIAVITPLIIAGVKLLVPRIPRAWLPFIAPVIGFGLDVVSHFATGSALNPTVALVLGAAGVGLREAIDQVKQAGGRVITDPPARIS